MGSLVAVQTATAGPALTNQCVAQEKFRASQMHGFVSSIVGNKCAAQEISFRKTFAVPQVVDISMTPGNNIQ